MLPIIDLDPSNYSCIYSVLLYIIGQSKVLNVVTLCGTFDQPLWFKLIEIIVSKSLPIVSRLAGFHTLMSFLESIGKLMEGSGLNAVLEAIYGKNTVDHIIKGKAIRGKGLRGNFLVDVALNTALITQLFPGCFRDNENNFEDESNASTLFKELRQLYEDLVSGESTWDEVSRSKSILDFSEAIENHKSYLQHSYRTAKLWIQYCEFINIVKLYICAERTSDWSLHLYATQKMLNLFAATGQIHYAKNSHL